MLSKLNKIGCLRILVAKEIEPYIILNKLRVSSLSAQQLKFQAGERNRFLTFALGYMRLYSKYI
jgi:hypothetical protein